MSRTNDLTNGNILKTLLRFALPFLAANLMQALYGATDLFVVGRYNGTSAISAVNIGSQVMQIITSFVIGCSMGSTVTLGKYIGSKDKEKAAKTFGNTFIIFIIFTIIVTPIMIIGSRPLAELMQTPAVALKETTQYIWICSLGIPFIVLFNISAAILRGMGDSKTPMYIVGIACVTNIIGDLVLTGYFGMGVVGVAIATSVAQLISSVCGIIMMIKHGFTFPTGIKYFRMKKDSIKEISFVGLPIALQDTLINVSFMVLTVIANERGVISSSAVGVVEKLMMFMFLVPSSMLSAISAFTAQNVGAKKKARAISSVKYGIVITGIFGILVCAISWICPNVLTGIFAKDKEVIFAAGEYLKTYSIDCIIVSFTFCINGYLCGISKSLVTFVHNVISIFLVRIPVAYILGKMFKESLLPMGIASPLGSLLSVFILIGYLFYQKKKNPQFFKD